MVWLVQERDNYVDGWHHCMIPLSFVKWYCSIYVDITLMDEKLRKFNFSFLK
jgi:hypothetical protein